jgi:hypothetical protein
MSNLLTNIIELKNAEFFITVVRYFSKNKTTLRNTKIIMLQKKNVINKDSKTSYSFLAYSKAIIFNLFSNRISVRQNNSPGFERKSTWKIFLYSIIQETKASNRFC